MMKFPGTFALALLMASSTAGANPLCSHLGDDVICPDGVAEGSMSSTFTADGILWSDGTETLGTSIPLFEDCPPAAMGSPGGSGSGMPGSMGDPLGLMDDSGSGMPGTSSGTPPGTSSDTNTIEDQLALTSDPGSAPAARSRATGYEFTDTHVIVDLVMSGGKDLASDFATSDSATRLKIREQLYLPTYIDDRPLEGTREALLEKFRESGNLAGAAAALADGSITYDQTTSEEVSRTATRVTGNQSGPDNANIRERISGRFIGMAPQDQVIHSTRGNCYEFVHLAAYFAGAGVGPVDTSTGVDNLIDESTRATWDGSSAIPAGKVVIGAVWNNKLQGGQDEYGFFHVGISLGNGYVVSNRGSGAQIERLEDVFGSVWYQNVYFGDYGGFERPDNTRGFLTDMRTNFDDQLAAIESDDSLDDAGKAHETAVYQERQALVDYLLGAGPRPGELSDEGEQFNDFLAQLSDGIANDKPYFFTDFKTYTAVKNPAPKPVNRISAGPRPPAPPEGRETAILIADWFNISEAGSLGVPAAGQSR